MAATLSSFLGFSDSESLAQKLIKDVTSQLSDTYGTLSERATSELQDSVKSFIADGSDELIKLVTDKESYTKLFEVIKDHAADVYNSTVEGDSKDDTVTSANVEQFENLFSQASKYSHLFPKKGRRLTMVALGRTGQGKTSTVNGLYGLGVKLKGGLESDTLEPTVYKKDINGVELIYVDMPGFLDSRGIDEANFNKICNALQRYPPDVILWVAKLTSNIDASEFEMIRKLTDKFGSAFWKHTLVVLTNANSDPPPEYYAPEFDELGEEIMIDKQDPEKMLNAAKLHYEAKANHWKVTFRAEANLPSSREPRVVFIENNAYGTNTRHHQGERLLIDNTPMWKTFIESVLETVSKQRAAFALLAMMGNRKSRDEDGKVFDDVPDSDEEGFFVGHHGDDDEADDVVPARAVPVVVGEPVAPSASTDGGSGGASGGGGSEKPKKKAKAKKAVEKKPKKKAVTPAKPAAPDAAQKDEVPKSTRVITRRQAIVTDAAKSVSKKAGSSGGWFSSSCTIL